MRVMMMIKADPDPGATPSEELFAEMGRYNDELTKAGVRVALAGLLPSAVGKRVKFSGGNRTVIDGPFPESKQVIAGYWILQVQSMDEAVEWANASRSKRWPGSTPASTAPRARSRSVRCSSQRRKPGTVDRGGVCVSGR